MDATGKRFYLLTHPRTASHLLLRILNLENQPNVALPKGGGYFFIDSIITDYKLQTRERPVAEWTQDERDQTMECYQKCFDNLQNYVSESDAENKIVFVKEHALFMTNPVAKSAFLFGDDSVKEPPWTVQMRQSAEETKHSSLNTSVLPDYFLQTWRPTFLIRHPALVCPSEYRTCIDNEGRETARARKELDAWMSYHWIRTLYDWYADQFKQSGISSSWPVILDADDVMSEPRTIDQYCELLGLDTSVLKYTWVPATEEEKAAQDPIAKRMLDTLSASSGIMLDKIAAHLDIDVEAEKWKHEFGDWEGKRLEGWVRSAMPDYEYLKARRLRPSS